MFYIVAHSGRNFSLTPADTLIVKMLDGGWNLQFNGDLTFHEETSFELREGEFICVD
jgi:hypothetical protein